MVVVEFSLPADYPDEVPLIKLVSQSDSLSEDQLSAVQDLFQQQVPYCCCY